MFLDPGHREPYPILYAPESFIEASIEVRLAVVNGCGPEGWKAALIPNTMYGLDISAACNIHDWMYVYGETLEGKQEADRVFLNNLLRIIDFKTSFTPLRWLRRRRALKYYLAVKHFGGPYFWNDKNPDKNMIWSFSAEVTP